MKVPPKQEQKFFEQDFNSYTGILIFGSDTSLVLDQLSFIEKKVLENQSDTSFSKITIEYEEIDNDASILQHELFSMNLLNTRKFIVIENTPKSIHSSIKSILLEPKTQHVLIFRSGELPPSSSTRKLFETDKNLAALHCYASNEMSVKALLLKKTMESKLSIDHNVIDFIAKNLRGEHSSILSEIDKILYYAQENRGISISEVSQIISAPSEKNSYDPLIHSIIEQNFTLVEQEISKLTDSGVHLVAISRNIANYFVKLLKAQTLIKQGMSEKFAIDTIKPPIFFKNIPYFKKGLQTYTARRITYIIHKLTELEIDLKSKNISPKLLWDSFLYNIFIKEKSQI